MNENSASGEEKQTDFNDWHAEKSRIQKRFLNWKDEEVLCVQWFRHSGDNDRGSLCSHAINDHQQSVRNHTPQAYKNTGKHREKAKKYARTTIKIMANENRKIKRKTIKVTSCSARKQLSSFVTAKAISTPRKNFLSRRRWAKWKSMFPTNESTFVYGFVSKRPKLLQYFKLTATAEKMPTNSWIKTRGRIFHADCFDLLCYSCVFVNSSLMGLTFSANWI